MNVLLIGSSGETGQSILSGLLRSRTPFNITALIRPSSTEKPKVRALGDRGVATIALNLDAPHNELVEALSGKEIVICAVDPFCVTEQIRLANAAKDAGVKRFIPSAFAPVCPPQGIMALRELKEEVINHVKKIYLPYTIIDIGWWYQSSLPKLPSGKIDYAVTFGATKIVDQGQHATSTTDLRDVGRYVARIITDPRTLNKYVFAYNEVWTQEDIFQLLEESSGERLPRDSSSEQEIEATIAALRGPYDKGGRSFSKVVGLVVSQYPLSVWLRGDSLPDRAEYLGYLSTKDLYPDFVFTSFKEYIREVMAGEAEAVYANRAFSFKK
ncbi:isoflavone reductase [Fusarium denticulatum]|uniref:Isoflavone reductase n=1 Tax=Fusarium denticulatum TaxID=48507 RepID=A0A8H5X8K3_9HYPO|nr:isoflavone reductase [Fusarium denticulatum]